MNDIASTLGRFANCFDLKDWPGLEALLSEQVDVDYSDLRGERSTISRADYVAQRRHALASLDTQHLLANAEIEVAGDVARCRVSGWILRRQGERRFDSHVIYLFRLGRTREGWRITAITQKVLWNEGDPGIHAGAKAAPTAPDG